MNGKAQISMVLTDSLIPYVNNARKHTDEQVSQIAASIREFGFNSPIITDGENGVLAGHGRLLAARKLGMTEVPAIEASHLSPAQRKAFILADNKIGDNSSFDYDLLALEFESLREMDFDIDQTGFSEFEISSIETSLGGMLDDGVPLGSGYDGEGGIEGGTKGEGGRHHLIFGSKTIQISEAELQALQARYEDYITKTGVSFGFVTELLGNGDE